MGETLFEELKRYVGWSATDEAALRALHPVAAPHFVEIARTFYDRILAHEQARTVLQGGESQVGQLKITLVAWMDRLLLGPWDEDYFERRCRIGRVHVRIALPQHYMFGAMNVVRVELLRLADEQGAPGAELADVRRALERVLDLELAIMLHTYREDLVAQAERTERLATFGQLVGSIGHELRNPLGVIETSMFLMQSRLPADERVQKHVIRIGEQLGVANAIITNLLDTIRDRPIRRERVRVGEVVRAAVDAVARPAGVRVEVAVPTTLEVAGDAVQLQQVVRNLVENGVQAVGSSGLVRVEAIESPSHVELAVQDDGPGVDPALGKRLFEPLVTTKAKGIGLGLALVRRIVERHGGTIAHEPHAGRGARFVVRLPESRP